jgi:LemA protein
MQGISKSWLAIGIVLVICFWQILGAFSLASSQQTVRGKTAQVWNQIDRASQLLPRLEQQLNTTVQLQKDLIDKIAAARNAIGTASQGDTSDPNNIGQATQASLIALRAFNENYPNLGLPELQQGLLDETAGSYNRIAYARSELINAQTSYNTARIWAFPIGMLMFPNMTITGENENPMQTLPPSKVGVTPAP